MARGSSQYRLSTCQLGLDPIYFLVDEFFWLYIISRWLLYAVVYG